ncbi:serine/threonine protein kinase [Paenibacillus agricola]|uniref:Serine/threonine protein kinase n=1 Tax=Paenibacillus agricola TaxID=2716264 RepID=A0ABX0J9H3_9BACL|nr:serine/threonine protein kinase [Paenibacillus agricola]NHN32035.1 serine/threonine protein kinase [Paenibacillus agricola]
MSEERIEKLIDKVEKELLPHLHIESADPRNPVVPHHVPFPWKLLGAGNYAAVMTHPEMDDFVVKVYAPGRPGIQEEVEVYRRLGNHPAYSECLYVGSHYLILRRLRGHTFYACLLRGIYIPQQAVDDIDDALDYARGRGLFPHDVHGKNVMLQNERGVVVDVSDFLKEDPCSMWDDVKTAYNRFYFPVFHKLPIPEHVLDLVRKSYRWLDKRSRSREDS